MSDAFVFVYLDGRHPTLAGRLSWGTVGTRYLLTFEYDSDYLRRPGAVSLVPTALPLRTAPFRAFSSAEERDLMFPGLRDAMPDGWGQRLMKRAAAKPLSKIEILLATGDDRVGDLAFGLSPTFPSPERPWRSPSSQNQMTISELIQGLTEFEADGEAMQRYFLRFVEGASSMGGSRPKATVPWKGGLWLAKFEMRPDGGDNPAAEYATMRLATECGLDVPEIDFTQVEGRDVFLIKRFDRSIAFDGALMRRGFVSAASMLEREEGASYADLADILRRHGGTNPRVQCRELWRRMVFNILVGNADDHLRNHGFVRSGMDWELSPLYDVVPIVRRAEGHVQALGVGPHGPDGTVANAIAGAGRFLLDSHEAVALLNDMMAVVAHRWRDLFREAGFSEVQIAAYAESFARAEEGAAALVSTGSGFQPSEAKVQPLPLKTKPLALCQFRGCTNPLEKGRRKYCALHGERSDKGWLNSRNRV